MKQSTLIKYRPKNHTLQDLITYGKQGLAYLITDLLDPKDGTHHKIQLSVCAEIIQDQLKEVYEVFNLIEQCEIVQMRLA